MEGTEASLILARRLTSGDLRPLLSQLVVLIAPIYNADGNEKVSVENRPQQFGPVGGMGTRENAKGLADWRRARRIPSIASAMPLT